MTSISIKCNDGRQFYTYQYITTKTPSENNENPENFNQLRNLKYYGSSTSYSSYSPSYYSYYSGYSTGYYYYYYDYGYYSGSTISLGWAVVVFGILFPIFCCVGIVVTIVLCVTGRCKVTCCCDCFKKNHFSAPPKKFEAKIVTNSPPPGVSLGVPPAHP